MPAGGGGTLMGDYTYQLQDRWDRLTKFLHRNGVVGAHPGLYLVGFCWRNIVRALERDPEEFRLKRYEATHFALTW